MRICSHPTAMTDEPGRCATSCTTSSSMSSAGEEPSPEVLEAIVAYIEDVDFVPNRRLGQLGKLTGPMSESEKHGEALFTNASRTTPP